MQIFGPHLLIAKVNISYQEPNLESSAPILTHFYSTVRAIQQILPIVLEYPTFEGDFFHVFKGKTTTKSDFFLHCSLKVALYYSEKNTSLPPFCFKIIFLELALGRRELL